MLEKNVVLETSYLFWFLMITEFTDNVLEGDIYVWYIWCCLLTFYLSNVNLNTKSKNTFYVLRFLKTHRQIMVWAFLLMVYNQYTKFQEEKFFVYRCTYVKTQVIFITYKGRMEKHKMQIRFQALSEWPIYLLTHYLIDINLVMLHKITIPWQQK